MNQNIAKSYADFDYMLNVYLFHTILIAPVIIFVGIKGVRGCDDKNRLSDEMFNFIMGLGLLTLMYHFAKLIQQLQNKN